MRGDRVDIEILEVIDMSLVRWEPFKEIETLPKTEEEKKKVVKIDVG